MLTLPSSSSSSSSPPQHKYDVFLSFRGEDTRNNFTDHLHATLKRKGILTFKDDPKLEPGKEIQAELFKAIQESWCSLIVFSQTYAFSRWCLDELVEIVQQKKEKGHKVFPIFYDVDPTDIRKQTGKVKEAFEEHEERYKEDRIQSWRTALATVADLKGWHLKHSPESDFIEDVVRNVSIKLRVRDSYVPFPDELIGISSRLEELLSMIDIEKDEVRIIGICGMGGIGKTTIANVVYNQMSYDHFDFDGTCFLADVREVSNKHGLVYLQKQLLSQILLEENFPFFTVDCGKAMIRRRLSQMKVLVVIDDADNLQHLKCLVGRPDWFGSGSRIIITTRDEQLLRSHKVHNVYKPTTLDDSESLHLFNIKAFNGDTVTETDFIELSKLVVKYADGLPLALEVLGSFLCDRDVALWRSTIERLKRDSNKEILDRLQIGFDGLENSEKNIFLDIACFFSNYEEKDLVIKVLDGCDFSALIGIDVLIKKSLIKDCGNYFSMHDLLREMGRKIVRQESLEPGKRSRLWEAKDVYRVLTNNTATEAIESMDISMHGEQNNMYTLCTDGFLKMKKLRLLKVFYLPNCNDLKYLSNELRYLEWHGYPFKSLPSSFQPDNLVALLLPYSRIEQLWKANRPLYKLKWVNLEGSQNLIKIPGLTMTPNLESLILKDCTRILDVHPSVGNLKKLKLLNLRGCKSLKSLPTKIQMESLERLIISGCSNLQKFPEIDGEMESLLELHLDGCSNLVSLPSSIDGCKCLKTLNLSGCSKVETLPENLQHVESLEELDLSETALRNPPSFIFQLKNLKVLSFNGCKGPPTKLRPNLFSLFKVQQRGSTDSMGLMLPSLSGLTSLTKLNLSDCNLCEGAIPSDICCLSSLERLNLCGNNFISLPATLTRLPKLVDVDLSDCRRLKTLPALLTNVSNVTINGCDSLEVFANPSTKRNSHYWLQILGINCYKFAENNNALRMLKTYIKVLAYSNQVFDIVLPGREITEWFPHQSDESSIKVPLPLNIQNDSQWIGVTFCCNFDFAFKYHDRWADFLCFAIIHGVKVRTFRPFSHSIEFKYRPKDHLWLCYWPRNFLYPSSEVETENLSITNLEYHECDEIFECSIFCTGPVKVKKCGIRIVYEKDLEEMEETKEQYSNSSSANFDDHGSTGNGDALIKRKQNMYEEEAGPSESDRNSAGTRE